MEAVPPLSVQPVGVPPELEELELLLEELELLDDELELLEELELLDELELLLLLDELELLDELGPPQPNMAITGAATIAEPKAFTMLLRDACAAWVEVDRAREWSSGVCVFIVLSASGGIFPILSGRDPQKCDPVGELLRSFPKNAFF